MNAVERRPRRHPLHRRPRPRTTGSPRRSGAFKVGHGKPRSRGDRDELFGGFGASWRGAFVGGELLVRAVTEGPAAERLPGNFPDYQLMP